ncbi:hypothetical protein [Aureibacillus halotolerans]|uniref:Uncharacterized protein n=1 Tax=Aureibacillus halotolerans TaxID=1508390 RepID=A0A4R6TPC3_9BACI|nr:hypothetical protein [Aureibacillus halotolerans]TDQ33444.1 hypothetical protein EV213_13118 [Aureibacillus halotolerans]
MEKVGLYVLTPVLSYLGGFCGYVIALRLFWDQTLGGETFAVMYIGSIGFIVVAVPIYLAIIRIIDIKCQSYRGVLYCVCCGLVFLLPTLCITLMYGSTDIFSPEAMLFHCFFVTSGILFGLGNWFFKTLSNINGA